jgi:hypothetical protein
VIKRNGSLKIGQDKHLQLLNIFNFPKKSRHKYNVAFLSVISGAKDEGYNLKYNNKRIDSKWNQLS